MSSLALRAELSDKPRRKRRQELPEAQKQEVRDAFDLFDTDKDDYIDYHELKVALRALGFELHKEQVVQLIKDYSSSMEEKISFDDFKDAVTDMILTRDPEKEMSSAFGLFDDDKTGKISVRNLRRVARELGENLSDDELRAMIDEFDLDGDGEINESEFIAIMTGEGY